jgi:hypothetical protein
MGQDWVETETSGCDLGDVRLNRRPRVRHFQPDFGLKSAPAAREFSDLANPG